jgi:hypothetical protein
MLTASGICSTLPDGHPRWGSRLSLQSVKQSSTETTRAPRHDPSVPTGADPSGSGRECNPSASVDPIEHRLINSITWTFRERFGRRLDALPEAAWQDPAGQGWRRVKHNASRDVWRARLDGEVYYLKYYAHQSWRDSLKRRLRGPACEIEFNSGIYALAAGIPAVRPVACAERLYRGGRTFSLLITEAIEPAYALNQYWETMRADDDAARRRRDTAYLIDLLAEMIARAHQSGFEHRDMHAANILVHPIAPGRYETVFVDLQNARLGRPLSDEAVVRNLAQLNQWFRRHSSLGDRLRFLRRYLRWRDEYEQAFEHSRPLTLSFEQLVSALVESAERHAHRLWAKRDRRSQRNNRYFGRIKLAGGWRGSVFLRCKLPTETSRASALVLDRDWWRSQLSNPLRWFEPDAWHLCKESHSALVTRATLTHGAQDVPVIIKRPRARNLRRGLRQLLAPSRSMRGWRTRCSTARFRPPGRWRCSRGGLARSCSTVSC